MTYTDLIADFGSFRKPVKTKNHKPFVLIATQVTRKGTDKEKTNYIYHLEGTEAIYYNMDTNDYKFAAVCRRSENMAKWYDALVREPLTPQEQQWMQLNSIEVLP